MSLFQVFSGVCITDEAACSFALTSGEKFSAAFWSATARRRFLSFLSFFLSFLCVAVVAHDNAKKERKERKERKRRPAAALQSWLVCCCDFRLDKWGAFSSSGDV
jgi:hypothetical protein